MAGNYPGQSSQPRLNSQPISSQWINCYYTIKGKVATAPSQPGSVRQSAVRLEVLFQAEPNQTKYASQPPQLQGDWSVSWIESKDVSSGKVSLGMRYHERALPTFLLGVSTVRSEQPANDNISGEAMGVRLVACLFASWRGLRACWVTNPATSQVTRSNKSTRAGTGKDPKLRSGCRPGYRTWTRNGRLAGLKHRLGRASCLPGVPVAQLREHEDVLENAGKGPSSGGWDGREVKPTSRAAVFLCWYSFAWRSARLPEECNAIGHRELQVCDKTGRLTRRQKLRLVD